MSPSVVLVLLTSVWSIADAEDFTAKQILEAADRSRGNVQGLVWNVGIVTTERGEESQNMLISLSAKNNNSLAKFIAPSRVKGQLMLVRDRNMWFIKPGVSKPVAISSRQKLSGGAANGDIASTNYAQDYTPRILGEESVNKEMCYVMELVAANKNVTYDKIKYWVSKPRLVGTRAEFYTVSGKVFKEAIFEYGNTIQSNDKILPFLSKMIITDTTTKNTTTLNYSKVQIKDIPASTFNLNTLVH